MRKILIAAFLSVGCGTDPAPAPSCQQAVTHYYDAGCVLLHPDGTQFTVLDAISTCKGALASAPAGCIDDVNRLNKCFDSVPTPSSTNAQCDCSVEQDALMTCS